MLYKTYPEYRFRSLFIVFILTLLLFTHVNHKISSETKWQKEYEEMRRDALFYARSCGVKGDSKIIKKAFDYSVRFWMRWDIIVRWISQESSFIPSAKSRVEAKGLTQVMEETGDYVGKVLVYSELIGLTVEEEKKLKSFEYDLYNIDDNLLIGFSYLKFLTLCSNNPQEALARYLAGKRWIDFIDSRYVQEITDGESEISKIIL